MNLIIGAVVATVILACAAFGGYRLRDVEAKNEAAVAKAQLEQTIKEANEAAQKVDIELAELRLKSQTAPPDPAIAIRRDTAKRIGAIR